MASTPARQTLFAVQLALPCLQAQERQRRQAEAAARQKAQAERQRAAAKRQQPTAVVMTEDKRRWGACSCARCRRCATRRVRLPRQHASMPLIACRYAASGLALLSNLCSCA